MGQASRAATASLSTHAEGILPQVILRFIHQHSVFSVALTLGTAVRILTMLSFQPALWFPDSFQHVGVAMRMHPYPVRPVGYPALLAILEPFGSFALVAAVQHLMGLAVAVLLYALMQRSGLPRWLAALGVLPQLLDGNQIYVEHLIQSEALFTFLIVAGLVTLLWNRDPNWITTAGAGGLLATATLVRPIGLAVLVVAGIYLLFPSPRWRACAAAAIAAAAPLLGYAAWFHSVHGRFALTTSANLFLYGRVAIFADCDRFDPPKRLAPLCEELPPGQRRASHLYIWTDSPLDRLAGVDPAARLPAKRVEPARSGPAGEFARMVVLNQPLDYLLVGGRDLSRTFAWSRRPFPSAGSPSYQFSHRPLKIHPHATYIAGAPALTDATTYERGSADTVVVSPYADWMIAYQRYVSLRGSILAALLLVSVFGIVCIRDLKRMARPSLLWAAGVLLLIIPPFMVVFDHRYVLPAIPFTVAAAAWFAHSIREGTDGPISPNAPVDNSD